MDIEKLFRELTDATATDLFLEGFCEIGETVLVGKNDVGDHYSMATSFFQAATELKEIILKNSGLHIFRYEYPMFFLYRHSLELFIKSVIPSPTKGHNIEKLLHEFVNHIKTVHRVDISKGWFVQSMEDFSKIDPAGQSFRYPRGLTGNSALAGDYIVNVKAWGETMSKMALVFSYLYFFQQGQNKGEQDMRTSSNRAAPTR